MDMYIVLSIINVDCQICPHRCCGGDDVETPNSLSSRCNALRKESL